MLYEGAGIPVLAVKVLAFTLEFVFTIEFAFVFEPVVTLGRRLAAPIVSVTGTRAGVKVDIAYVLLHEGADVPIPAVNILAPEFAFACARTYEAVFGSATTLGKGLTTPTKPVTSVVAGANSVVNADASVRIVVLLCEGPDTLNLLGFSFVFEFSLTFENAFEATDTLGGGFAAPITSLTGAGGGIHVSIVVLLCEGTDTPISAVIILASVLGFANAFELVFEATAALGGYIAVFD